MPKYQVRKDLQAQETNPPVEIHGFSGDIYIDFCIHKELEFLALEEKANDSEYNLCLRTSNGIVFWGNSIDFEEVDQKMLMNPYTGSVDTAENWEAEGWTPDNSELIEVEKDAEGNWGEK